MIRERWIEAYAEMLADREVDNEQSQVEWAQVQYERAVESSELQAEELRV